MRKIIYWLLLQINLFLTTKGSILSSNGFWKIFDVNFLIGSHFPPALCDHSARTCSNSSLPLPTGCRARKCFLHKRFFLHQFMRIFCTNPPPEVELRIVTQFNSCRNLKTTGKVQLLITYYIVLFPCNKNIFFCTLHGEKLFRSGFLLLQFIPHVWK